MRGLVLGLATLAGGGLLLALTHSAHAASDEEPSDVADRVSKALASNDPGVMRGEADALDREGYRDAAKQLRAEADKLDPQHTKPAKPPKHPQAVMSAAGQHAAAVMTGHTAGGVTPSSSSPGWQANAPAAVTSSALPPGASSTGIEDPGRTLAQQVTANLQSIGGLAGRGKENKALVGRFQGFEKLTADSKYGPGTATRILQRYGIVPVAPFYWSKKNASTQKKAFIAFVNSYATGDPDRRAQYDQLIKDTNRS